MLACVCCCRQKGTGGLIGGLIVKPCSNPGCNDAVCVNCFTRVFCEAVASGKWQDVLVNVECPD